VERGGRAQTHTEPGKRKLRTRLRTARGAVSDVERAAAAEAVARHLLALSALAGAGSVLGYAAAGAELSLDPWLRALLERGEVAVHLPRVVGDGLEVVRVRDLDADVAPGWRGLREPVGAAIAPSGLDVAVVPGLGFDLTGARLGQGGGHVDRLLARLDPRVVKVGVCFEIQVVGAVPTEPHDVGMDVVVTEAGARLVR